MQTCQDIIDLLSDYLDGELSDEAHREFDRHLTDCPPCVRFLQSLERTRDLVHSLRCEEMPPELQTMLRKLLAREARRRSS